MCCVTRGKGSGLSLPVLPLSASLVSVGKTCLWDLVSSLPTCVQENSALLTVPLSLSLFLSLSLCFPFILLPRSRSRMKQGTGLESASYQKNLDKRNCFLSTTAAALVFFFFFHTTVVPHYPVPGSIFFFFWGFEVSVLQWLLQKKRCSCCLESYIQGYHYHLSKFHIYALVYCIYVFPSGLLHSV